MLLFCSFRKIISINDTRIFVRNMGILTPKGIKDEYAFFELNIKF